MFLMKPRLKAMTVGTIILCVSAFGANDLKMATTTSTDNTGLLDVLAPLYKKDSGVELKWVAVGTGNALKLGQNCDVDIVFVHAPSLEKKYIQDGYFVDRTPVMFNDFVIIGNPIYKAKFEGKSIQEAFKIIENEQYKFVSRGDNSGTHNKEKSLWKAALGKVPERQSWYIQAGQGMLATINVATEQRGISFTDRSTFIKNESNHKGNLPLTIILEGDKNLNNYYSIMAVNPKLCANADYEGTKQFINWIVSDKIQKTIGDFKLLGKQLFTPDAKSRVE